MDARRRISPKGGPSPGVSTLAAMAGTSTLDQPKKFKISFPMDPRTALLNLSKHLNEYEKPEILDYETIYYLNCQESKSSRVVSPDGTDNFGFDNDKGEYIFCEVHDHIAYRYEVIKRLGKGSFGQVFKCFDHKKKEYCALKILRNKKRLHK